MSFLQNKNTQYFFKYRLFRQKGITAHPCLKTVQNNGEGRGWGLEYFSPLLTMSDANLETPRPERKSRDSQAQAFQTPT